MGLLYKKCHSTPKKFQKKIIRSMAGVGPYTYTLEFFDRYTVLVLNTINIYISV